MLFVPVEVDFTHASKVNEPVPNWNEALFPRFTKSLVPSKVKQLPGGVIEDSRGIVLATQVVSFPKIAWWI